MSSDSNSSSRRTFLKLTSVGGLGLVACGDDSDPTDGGLSDARLPDGALVDAASQDTSTSDTSTSDTLNASDALDASPPPTDAYPLLSNFHVRQAEPTRIYFDSSKPITGSTTTGFTISGQTIAGLTVAADATTGHYFALASALTFWDNNTVRYEGGSDLVDTDENGLIDFTLTYIANNIEEPVSSVIRYVNADATGGGDGTSDASAWTIDQMNANASAGMTIYMRAGSYGNATLTRHSGREAEPIKFIGYKTTPNDITSLYYNYGDGALDPSEMPLFDGGDRTADVWFYEMRNTDYTIVKNLQLTGYRGGFTSQSMDGFRAENVLIKDIGDGVGQGNGDGFRFRSVSASANKVSIVGSTVINATHTAIGTTGKGNMYRDCKVYCNEVDEDNVAGMTTDYYYSFGHSEGILIGCLAHKDTPNIASSSGNGHFGHAISIKPTYTTTERGVATHNLIEGNEVINCGWGVQARWDGVEYNVYRANNIHANTAARATSVEGQTAFIVMGGSGNVFENNYVHDTDNFIAFEYSTEDRNRIDAGNDNVMRNNIIANIAKDVISFWGGGTNGGNKFFSNTVYNVGGRLFDGSGTSTGCEMKNNIFHSVATTDPEDGWAIEDNNWFMATPAGAGASTEDPVFADLVEFVPTNAMLRSGSALAGVEYDRNHKQRSQTTPTIGAVEID